MAGKLYEAVAGGLRTAVAASDGRFWRQQAFA
jgi:hypothetical protein